MPIQLKSQNVTNMYTPIELITTGNASFLSGGITDHGMLHGLSHNDHPQYLLSSVLNSHTHSDLYLNTSVSSAIMPVGSSSSFINVSNSNDYFYTSNNTFANNTHTHGSNVSVGTQSGGNSLIVFTSSSNGLTLLQPPFLTTGALSNHSHSIGTAVVSGSNVTIQNGNSINIGIPAFITTAAQSDHSHGAVNITSVSGTTPVISSNSTAWTLHMPNYITTAYGAAIKGSGSYTQNTGTIEFKNGGGVTFGLSNDGVMTASVADVGGAQTGISGIVGGAGTATSGTVIFSNSNGVSFGMSDNTMTASYTVPGVTVFSNSNNVSFGLAGSTITASATFAQTANVHNVTLSGNTLGTMTQVSSGTMTLAGGSNVTLSQDGNAITIIGAAQGGVQTGISGIGASNTTYNSGTVIWSGQNNITIGTSTDGNSQYIRLSVGNYLTTAMQSASSSVFARTGFTTASTAGTDIAGTLNTNGLNLAVPKWIITAAQSNQVVNSFNGSTGQISFVTGSGMSTTTNASTLTFGLRSDISTAWSGITSNAFPSSDTTKFAGPGTSSTTTNGVDLKFTLNSLGLSYAQPAYITTGAAGGGAALRGSGTYSQNTGTVQFANSNNITFGLSSDGVMTASGGFVNSSESGNVYFVDSLGSNITWGSSSTSNSTYIYATAGGGTGGGGGVGLNTAATNVTWTVNTSGISFDAGAYLTTYLSEANWLTTSISGAVIAMSVWQSTMTASSRYNTIYVPAYLTAAAGGGIAGSIGGNSTSAGAGYSNITSGTMILAGGNNITLSQDGASITISGANVGGAQTGISGIGVSDTTYSSGTLIFSNQSNITIGSSVNGGSQYIRLSVADQSTHSHIVYAATDHSHGSINISATSNSTETAMRFTSNSSGWTIVQPSFLTTAANSTHEHTHDFWIGVSNTTFNEHTVFFSGQSNITIGTSENGDSYYIRLSVADAIPLGNSTAYATSVLANTFISSQSTHAHPYVASGDSTAWQTSVLSGTFAQTGHTHSDLYQSTGAYLTTAAEVSHSHGNVSLSLSNVSGTYSSASNGLTISLTGPSVAAGAITVSAGALSGTRDNIVFSNSNSISFGMSGSTITASIPIGQANFVDSNGIVFGSSVGTGASSLSSTITAVFNQGYILTGNNTAGTTSFTTSGSNLVLSGGNNITLSANSNNQIVISAGAAGGVGTSLSTVSTDGSVLLGGINTAGISLSVPAWLTAASGAGISYELEGNNTSGTTGSNVNTLYFSGGSNVTLSGNSNTIVIHGGAGGAGAALQGSGTYSQNSGTIQFANSNNITFGLTNNQMTASIPVGTVNFSDNSLATWSSSAGAGASSVSTSIYIGSLAAAGGGVVVAGSAASTVTNGTLVFSNANGVSFGLNGSTMTASIGTGDGTIGFYEPYVQTNTSAWVPGVGSWYFAPFIAPNAIGGGRLNFLANNTSTAGILIDITGSYHSSQTGGKNQSYTYQLSAALYAQDGTGDNSTRWSSVWGNTFSYGLSHRVSVSQSGAASNVSASIYGSISYINDIGPNGETSASQFASSNAASGTNTSMASTWMRTDLASIRNMLSNQQQLVIPFNTTISEGNYILGIMYSSTHATNTSGTSYPGASALIMSNLNVVGIQRVALAGYRMWGQTTSNANDSPFFGAGVVYSAASAAAPQYLRTEDMRTIANGIIPYFNFQRRGLTN